MTKNLLGETYKKVSVYSKNSWTKEKDSQTKEIFQKTSSSLLFWSSIAAADVSKRSTRSEELESSEELRCPL
jgi:hypothetical protein